ncbi:uncharacterized protein DS421_19g673710 [Arachis hypogaea]|uniref:AHK4/CRE1/WOL first receiver domain-containing protein n=1 Tax=Arachis hypogaea TaxID=3818 RepID=A0A6B9VFM0_ARAHY|nr:uncharacterized protein DS421_19g673710 [Arachis hypogaea]
MHPWCQLLDSCKEGTFLEGGLLLWGPSLTRYIRGGSYLSPRYVTLLSDDLSVGVLLQVIPPPPDVLRSSAAPSLIPHSKIGGNPLPRFRDLHEPSGNPIYRTLSIQAKVANHIKKSVSLCGKNGSLSSGLFQLNIFLVEKDSWFSGEDGVFNI